MANARADRNEVARQLMQTTELTRDALPYTEEFEKLLAAFKERTGEDITHHLFWRLMSNTAKRGGWKGKHRGDPAPTLTHQQNDQLRSLVKGKLGSRDSLAYTNELAEIVRQINVAAGLTLNERQTWRAICNLGKVSLRPDVNALLKQGIDSVILAIEHFNRPSERGRLPSVLMMLDHGCEMLLKAALLQRGSDIRNPKNGFTHAFEFCVNKATTDGAIKFLSDDERRSLLVLNGLRDQAQHYLADVSEQMLYAITQSAVTLFSELLSRVFGEVLTDHVPRRVLPISVYPPQDINVVMDEEFSQLKALLQTGNGDQHLTEPKLRSLLAIDRALRLENTQVPDEELHAISEQVRESARWGDVFRGISQIKLTTDGSGVDVTIHISKKEGVPVRIATDGEDPHAVIAVRRVNDTDFYCYNAKALAAKVGLSINRLVALIKFMKLYEQPDCFKEIMIGKSHFKMYSANALSKIKEALPTVNMDEVWKSHRPKRRALP